MMDEKPAVDDQGKLAGKKSPPLYTKNRLFSGDLRASSTDSAQPLTSLVYRDARIEQKGCRMSCTNISSN